jgi:hypothetical protein
VFVGVTVLLAYVEEGAWDLLVWREHTSLFGGWRLPTLPDEVLAVIVPALILPQATHYVLDAWIWKFGGSSPRPARVSVPWGPIWPPNPQSFGASRRSRDAPLDYGRSVGTTMRRTYATRRQALLVALDVGDEPAGGAEEAGVGVAGADELDAEG